MSERFLEEIKSALRARHFVVVAQPPSTPETLHLSWRGSYNTDNARRGGVAAVVQHVTHALGGWDVDNGPQRRWTTVTWTGAAGNETEGFEICVQVF